MQWYLRDMSIYRFWYCKQTVERQSFSFLFWTKPFDGSGWVLIALSMLGLTLVLKGNWLDVFAALLVRQSAASLDSNKTLILFVVAAIVITCGYESIISSDVIVPLPFREVRNLKDLVDSGYRIIGWSKGINNSTILEVLRRENIPHSSTQEPPFSPGKFTLPESIKLLSKCNVTKLFYYRDFQDREITAKYMHTLYGNRVKCGFAKETIYEQHATITYSGYSAQGFHHVLLSFQESGILNLLFKYDAFVEFYQKRVQAANEQYRYEKAEVPFQLNDPKIISIFIGWGFLTLFASLAFLAESLIGCTIKVYLVTAAIKHFSH
jgi:hypothetical protein